MTRLVVVDPATEAEIACLECVDPRDLDGVLAAATVAQRGWKTDEGARRQALRRIADRLVEEQDRVAAILTAEQGKPLRDAVAEVLGSAAWFRYFAELPIPVEVLHDGENGRTEVRRRPLGVVAAITPWNFPVQLAAMKLAPALLAGNAVVVKPSPYTPMSTVLLGELAAQVLPPHVLTVVVGDDDLGRALTSHPVPRKVSFTGSTSAGVSVALTAAKDLKRVTLELGGNDAAVLLDDIDVEAIGGRLFWAAFTNNGQVCAAVKRVYAPRAIYADVVEVLAARARRVVVGAGTDPDTKLGPVNNRPQLERVGMLTADALRRGAVAASGGSRLEREGWFYEPTILARADDGMPVVDQEQFGPVLPVVAYDDVDDAVRRANGTPFGLSGSVWSADVERAGAVAERLECGTVWLNGHLELGPEQPVTGMKLSGIGVENGPWGLDQLCELQVVRRVGPSLVGGS